MKKPKPSPICIYVRPLVKGDESQGFVWRLQRGRVELLRDVQPTREDAAQCAEGARMGVLVQEYEAGMGGIKR